MKRTIIIPASAIALSVVTIMSAVASPIAAQAAHATPASARTATFLVAKMTCATCPITVKKAMQGVTGVRSVVVDLAARKAKVVFDPKRTNVSMIAAASTNAGFPAKPVG